MGLASIDIGIGLFYVGNLDAKRDWGHAKDYIAVTWAMLQEDTPND